MKLSLFEERIRIVSYRDQEEDFFGRGDSGEEEEARMNHLFL